MDASIRLLILLDDSGEVSASSPAGLREEGSIYDEEGSIYEEEG